MAEGGMEQGGRDEGNAEYGDACIAPKKWPVGRAVGPDSPV